MDFSVVREAGLTDAELGEIVGVSRVMAWKYRTGKAAPRDGVYNGVDLYARCDVTLKVLRALVKKGQLPKSELVVPRGTVDPGIEARRRVVISKIQALVDQHIVAARANT